MIDVEKQIEEVMELVQYLMNAKSSSQRIREKKSLESKLRTLLSSAQSGEQVPYAVLYREIGEDSFFDNKPVKPGSVHHLHANKDPHYDCVELYTHPAPALEVSQATNKKQRRLIFDDLYPHGATIDVWRTFNVIADAIESAASQPNGEA